MGTHADDLEVSPVAQTPIDRVDEFEYLLLRRGCDRSRGVRMLAPCVAQQVNERTHIGEFGASERDDADLALAEVRGVLASLSGRERAAKEVRQVEGFLRQ